ncbi:hypothetical protein C8T65DRAFT_692822 [Cerioporus squamosus]|nr:hypothetical protein C8T65DRAFT_692822 [Cerioporus squamosus]
MPPPPPPAHIPSSSQREISTSHRVSEDQPPEEQEQEEPPHPGFASIMWSLDPRANEATRISNDYEEFYEDCRITVRSTGIYPDYDRVLTEGLMMVLEEPSEEELPSQTCEEFCPAVETEYVWPAVHAYLPELEEHAGYIVRHPDLIAHISKFMTAVMKKVRGDDLVRVRPITAKLAAIPDPDDLFDDKANRGWKSVQFGRMLVPYLDLPEFDADPERYCALASSGKKLILSEDWPVCLYDLKIAVPGQSMPGFLMSKYLLRMYIKIFFGTGKDSAFADRQNFRKSGGKRSVAQRAQLKEVHKEARFCLNSLTEWSDIDGADWSGDAFVRSIYQAIFNAPDWAEQLQRWWTNKIYGNGFEESEEVREKRKHTGLQKFLQECERPRKRLKPCPRTRDRSPPASDNDEDDHEHSQSQPRQQGQPRSHSTEV